MLVLAALAEELGAFVGGLAGVSWDARPPARVASGTLGARRVHAALTGIGKVAAGSTAAALLERLHPAAVLMVGVAGALDPALGIGDVVVARRLCQHDLDASPLFPPLEVPQTGRRWFDTDAAWTRRLHDAAAGAGARVLTGDVATGDRFIHGPEAAARLRALVPTAACVEMEGAAVAQVCHAFGVPLAVCRIISDKADGTAAGDFLAFIRGVEAALAGRVLLGALLAA